MAREIRKGASFRALATRHSNDGGNEGGWVNLRLEGTRSNRYAIERLRVSRPSGLVEEFPAVEVSRFVTVREGDGTAVAP